MTKKNIVNFGEVKIPERWEDMSLKQYQELQKYVDEVKAENDSDELKLNKYKLLSIFIDRTEDEIMDMPIVFIDKMMSKLLFFYDTPDMTPSDTIMIDGVEFKVNFMEEMTVKEYEDTDTIIKSDVYNLAALMAVMCRKVIGEHKDEITGKQWKTTEKYNQEFANIKFDERVKMFENLPITTVLPVIAFFLQRNVELSKLSVDCLTELQTQVDQYAQDIENSVKSMGFKKWLWMPQMIRLKKLRKSIKNL